MENSVQYGLPITRMDKNIAWPLIVPTNDDYRTNRRRLPLVTGSAPFTELNSLFRDSNTGFDLFLLHFVYLFSDVCT